MLWGKRRRKNASRVYKVIDELGWNLAKLTKEINKNLPKGHTKFSRSSVQFWAAGERTTWYRGTKGRNRVEAPKPVRVAAEKATREAAKIRKDPGVILRPDDWPSK